MDFKILSGLRALTAPQVVRPPILEAAGLSAVRAYWEALRQDGNLPARADLDPRGMSGALERIFLAERIGVGIAQIRIAGSVLGEIAAMDARGLPLSCLFSTVARPQLGGVVDRVFQDRVAADLLLEAERDMRRPPLEARLILLPLLDAKGEPTLVLGCIALTGAVGRMPRRFDITRATEERLIVSHSDERAVGAGSTEVDPSAASVGPRTHLHLVHSAR